MKKNLLLLLVLTSFIVAFTSCKKTITLFSSGFVEENEKGLYVYDFDLRKGTLEKIAETELGPMPSYLCFSDKHSLIYAINEVFEFKGEFGGGLSTYKYESETHKVEKKDELLVPYGGPCNIALNHDSTYLFIAGYANGSVSAVRLDEQGLPLSVTDTILFYKDEPDDSHAHMIIQDPAGKFIYITDLGLDKIYILPFDTESGRFRQNEGKEISLPENAGPRHFVFNADGTKFYLINELGSTIMAFDVKPDGSLDLLQTAPTLDPKFINRNACADIHLGKDGRFLYGSNRGENTIVVFSVGVDGLLTLAGRVPCGGEWPRNFVIDPSGRYMLVGNQKSNEISVFRINKKTGMPEKTGVNYARKAPSCLKFWN